MLCKEVSPPTPAKEKARTVHLAQMRSVLCWCYCWTCPKPEGAYLNEGRNMKGTKKKKTYNVRAQNPPGIKGDLGGKKTEAAFGILWETFGGIFICRQLDCTSPGIAGGIWALWIFTSLYQKTHARHPLNGGVLWDSKHFYQTKPYEKPLFEKEPGPQQINKMKTLTLSITKMNFETTSLYFKINKQINKTKKVRKNLNNNSKKGQFTRQSTVHFNLSSKWPVILVIISAFFRSFMLISQFYILLTWAPFVKYNKMLHQFTRY